MKPLNRQHSLLLGGAALVLAILLTAPSAAPATANTISTELERRIGSSDAVVLAAPDGRTLFKKNADKHLVPASILKIFTALVALQTLGEDFHFTTEFYLDRQLNLTIKGLGDPLLISEVVALISSRLAGSLSNDSALRSLVLDETHFAQPLTIPGVSASSQPYDAPNGALCVNFNTVNFNYRKGRYVSAEPQTPMLPFALDRIKRNRANSGRIVLSREENENTLYAGELFKYFLEREHIRFSGPVKIGKVGSSASLILNYQSPFGLTEIIAKMLEHSNNFITNQLLIAAGIKTHGAPGSLDKAVQAARSYAAENLGIENLKIVEGSGISRENRITANQMMAVLRTFEPHYQLMRRDRTEFYKTGTLRGISTRAGYLLNAKGRRHAFVIIRNSPGKTAPDLMPHLKQLAE